MFASWWAFCLIWLVFRPLILIGFAIILVWIVSATGWKKSRYCQDCYKTWKYQEETIADTKKSKKNTKEISTNDIIKGQWLLSIFLIIFWGLILQSAFFGGLLNIICWIILLPSILIKTPIYNEITNKRFYFLIVFLFAIGLVSILPSTSNHIDQNPSNLPSTSNHIDQNPSNIVNSARAYTFNVPSLVWKSLNELKKSFWAWFTKDYTQPSKIDFEWGLDEWSITASKDGYDLLITYNWKTKAIIDFFLSADNDSDNNKNILMEVWNLIDYDDNYSIEEVHTYLHGVMIDKITGIKIIPK